MSFELVTAPGNGDAFDTTSSERTTRSRAKFRKSSPGGKPLIEENVCSPSDWWKLSIKDSIEANEIHFAGPRDNESWEYKEVEKILKDEPDSEKGFSWQPLLCRNVLQPYGFQLALELGRAGFFVFVAFTHSSHPEEKPCVVMLSIMVVEMKSPTNAYVHLLCSGVPTVGGQLLAYALTKLKVDNKELESVSLHTTKKAEDFYKKHGLTSDKDGMSFDFRNGLRPVHVAARNNDEVVLRTLLKAGANVNQANKQDNTPLIFATEYGHEAVVRALLAAGADVNQANEDGSTPLIYAAVRGHEAVVGALLAAGANVNQANKHDNTPLSFAARRGHEAVVGALLAAGADVNQANEDGSTPLSFATEYGHEAVVRALKRQHFTNQV